MGSKENYGSVILTQYFCVILRFLLTMNAFYSFFYSLVKQTKFLLPACSSSVMKNKPLF